VLIGCEKEFVSVADIGMRYDSKLHGAQSIPMKLFPNPAVTCDTLRLWHPIIIKKTVGSAALAPLLVTPCI
jgi:hypothetical protein